MTRLPICRLDVSLVKCLALRGDNSLIPVIDCLKKRKQRRKWYKQLKAMQIKCAAKRKDCKRPGKIEEITSWHGLTMACS